MGSGWWRQASFYQIYPRSFFDANNDGEGDLQGIISKIDYLQSLNIDAIWLCPFYPSPRKDGGYDVADPRAVDARFGTIEDFDLLTRELHLRNMKILIDLVPNHVSAEHPWFQPIAKGTATVEELSRFHILDGINDGPPNNWVSVFGGSAWSPLPDGKWYLHLFDASQPDLNWTNEDVFADGLETLRFWLDRGVDGFRVDVAFGLMKDMTYANHHDPQGLINAMRLDLADTHSQSSEENSREVLRGGPFFDRDEVHEVYRSWRQLLNTYSPERMTVAEAWAYPASRAMDYARADELHQVFNFDFMVVKYDAGEIRKSIDSVLSTVSLVGAPPTWVLSNHDSPRVVSRLGENGLRKANVLASIAHALPGGIYVYQGEELGLADAQIPNELRQDPIFSRTAGKELGRDGARVPLPWEKSVAHFGFSSARSVWLPQPPIWKELSVESQESDSNSNLNLYRQMLKIRRYVNSQEDETSFSWTPQEDSLVAFARGETLLVVANVSERPVKFHLPALWLDSRIAVQVGEVEFSGGDLQLSSHSSVWLIYQVNSEQVPS